MTLITKLLVGDLIYRVNVAAISHVREDPETGHVAVKMRDGTHIEGDREEMAVLLERLDKIDAQIAHQMAQEG